MITSPWWGQSFCFYHNTSERFLDVWECLSVKWSGKWKVDKICSMHLLLLYEVLTMVSYLRMDSLLVLCAEVTWLGAKVQCHATQQRGAGCVEKTANNIGRWDVLRSLKSLWAEQAIRCLCIKVKPPSSFRHCQYFDISVQYEWANKQSKSVINDHMVCILAPKKKS